MTGTDPLVRGPSQSGGEYRNESIYGHRVHCARQRDGPPKVHPAACVGTDTGESNGL